jgi:hypothetical protein
MADFSYNPVAGVPFSGTMVMKDSTGNGGPYVPVSLGVAGFLPVLSITTQSALNTVGVALDNQGVRNNHCVVVTANGTVSGGTVQLQGSQDNVNWVNLLAGSGQNAIATPATGTTVLGTANLTPFRFLRAFIATAITGGGTITAYVASAG